MTNKERQARHLAALQASGGTRLTVRLSGEDLAALRSYAEARGLSVTAAIVALIRASAPTPQP